MWADVTESSSGALHSDSPPSTVLLPPRALSTAKAELYMSMQVSVPPHDAITEILLRNVSHCLPSIPALGMCGLPFPPEMQIRQHKIWPRKTAGGYRFRHWKHVKQLHNVKGGVRVEANNLLSSFRKQNHVLEANIWNQGYRQARTSHINQDRKKGKVWRKGMTVNGCLHKGQARSKLLMTKQQYFKAMLTRPHTAWRKWTLGLFVHKWSQSGCA